MDAVNPELQADTSQSRGGRRRRRISGDQRGDKGVSPVSSDATGVRQGDERGRDDATRPRRRYITY